MLSTVYTLYYKIKCYDASFKIGSDSIHFLCRVPLSNGHMKHGPGNPFIQAAKSPIQWAALKMVFLATKLSEKLTLHM